MPATVTDSHQAVTCARCAAPVGETCRTVSGKPCGPHGIRKVAAAHADPALDGLGIGPTSVCGFCGVLPQRHRVTDSIATCIAADQGDTDLDLAEEFGVTAEAAAAVRAWMKRWPRAWK